MNLQQHGIRGHLKSVWNEKRVISICFFIALAQFQYGYDSATIAGFQSMPGFLNVFGYTDAITSALKGKKLLQSLISVGALVACIFIFNFGRFISPRAGLWTASLVGLVSIAAQIGSTSIAALYFGRIMLGISNGFYSTYSAIYIGESTPAYLRGAAIGMPPSIPDSTCGHVRHSSGHFRGFNITSRVTSVYISRDQDNKAKAAIRKLRGITDEANVQEDITVMKSAWLEDMEMRATTHLLDAFRGRDLRRTLLTIATAVAQAATGIFFISAFSVFSLLGDDIYCYCVTGNMLSFPSRTVSRPPTPLDSCLAAKLRSNDRDGSCIHCLFSKVTHCRKSSRRTEYHFTWVYGLGQGPVLWALQTEFPSQRLRTQTVGFAQGSGFLFSWLSAYCTPYFINPEALNWGPKYCYIWAGSNFILAIFTFFFIPETRGRSLEQLDEMFNKRLPAWKFRGYITDLQQADQDDFAMEKYTKDETSAVKIEHK
ncbi:hypothetical protein J3E73DRAFT_394681 [Bipolaris maydis]|nr:hypothetical protein J3E73DRAFT_394681 [Bipolaris maydis]